MLEHESPQLALPYQQPSDSDLFRLLLIVQATNMLEHEDEIYARPPRTWFQSEKQKKETAQRAKEAKEGEPFYFYLFRGGGGGGWAGEGEGPAGHGPVRRDCLVPAAD